MKDCVSMKISIITINYNNCEGLLQTIRSVVSQKYSDFEYIVIDGGSTDGSVEVIKEYSSQLNYWVSERDKGIYHAMNKGIDHARGEYCLFLNSGDILHDENVLAEVIPQLSADIVVGAIRKAASGYIKRLKINEPLVLLDFWYENPMPHQSTFIKLAICKQIRYDETLKIVGDLKFFLQAIILMKCSCQSIDTIVSDFDEGGISTKVNSDDEWKKVFMELLTPSLFFDYQRLLNRRYDSFFVKLRLRKYYKIVYYIAVLFVRFIGFFRPTARFAKEYPLILK